MSTNLNRSSQVIEGHPHPYYGWALSGTSDNMSLHLFSTADRRAAFVAEVGKVLGTYGLTEPGAHERAAGFLAFAVYGDSDADQQWGDDLLNEYLAEVLPDADQAIEAVAELVVTVGDFDPSSGPEGATPLVVLVLTRPQFNLMADGAAVGLEDVPPEVDPGGLADSVLAILRETRETLR